MSRDLARVSAAVAPDLVHAHWLPEFGWMAAREHLGPLVCSAWGSDVFGVRGLGRRRSLRALRAAELVLADSERPRARDAPPGGARASGWRSRAGGSTSAAIRRAMRALPARRSVSPRTIR